MGRRSKSSHPLAVARKFTGKTQKELARFVGVSAVIIQKVEAGEKKLTYALAEQIGFAIGVEPATLFESGHPYPRAIVKPEAYSESFFREWQNYFTNTPADKDLRVIQYSEIIKEKIEALLFASNVGQRHKFPLVFWRLCQAITQIGAQLNLGEALESVRIGKAGPEDRAAYELGKENAFLYRSLGRAELRPDPVSPKLTKGTVKHIQELQARISRETRGSILEIVGYLSRRSTQKTARDESSA